VFVSSGDFRINWLQRRGGLREEYPQAASWLYKFIDPVSYGIILQADTVTAQSLQSTARNPNIYSLRPTLLDES